MASIWGEVKSAYWTPLRDKWQILFFPTHWPKLPWPSVTSQLRLSGINQRMSLLTCSPHKTTPVWIWSRSVLPLLVKYFSVQLNITGIQVVPHKLKSSFFPSFFLFSVQNTFVVIFVAHTSKVKTGRDKRYQNKKIKLVRTGCKLMCLLLAAFLKKSNEKVDYTPKLI